MMPRSARWDVHVSLDYLLSDTMSSVGAEQQQNSRCYMKGNGLDGRTGESARKEELLGGGEGERERGTEVGGFGSVVR